MGTAIIIFLALVILGLVWGVSTTAKRLRFLEKKCDDQRGEIIKLRWENEGLQHKVSEQETELLQLRENSSNAKYPAHGGYFGH